MATQPVLELRGVRKSYGELVAVDLLDLEVQPGECVALIGHNGSGKTTTLRLVAGLLEPSDGRVRVAGGDLAQERSRAALSFVPDSPLLYPDLTVREHLELVGLAHGVGVGLDGRVAELLELFELTSRGGFLPGQLSRGMRQEGSAGVRAGPAVPAAAAGRARSRARPALPAGAAADPSGGQAGRGGDPALHPPARLRRGLGGPCGGAA
jgi:ABC-type sugar transport system ATPase subunit